MERYQQSITKWKKFTTRFETIPKNNSKTQEPIQSPNDSLIISLYKIIQLNIELYPTEYLIEKLETLKDILFNPINIRLIERQEIDIQNIHDWLIQLRLSKFNDPILNVEFLGLILKSGLQMNLLQMIEIAREKTFFSTNITHHNTISVIWIHDSNLNWKEEEIFTKNPKNIQNTNFIEIESDHNQKEVLDLVEDSYIKSHGKIRVVISTNAPFDSVVILNDLRKEKSYYFPILIYFPEKFFHENLLEISICEVLIKKNKFSHVWTTENPRIIQYFCCLNMMKIESNVYNQMSTHLNSLIIEARDTKGIISGQIIKKIMLISKLDFSRLCVGGEVPPQRFENFVAEKKPTENLHVLDSDFDIPFTGASFVFYKHNTVLGNA
ncbi:hypothetical protein M0811_06977 [Anaeramoeba ignava]|uniref:Uncharacterized protein n=1 Tax=Anaeramoeba ignava TaxID=1746090 RepID=A0A9Q0LRU7_ANAIG|nr:hypothetical protein M0811_06977 [Anaeramoeba ignava]